MEAFVEILKYTFPAALMLLLTYLLLSISWTMRRSVVPSILKDLQKNRFRYACKLSSASSCIGARYSQPLGHQS